MDRAAEDAIPQVSPWLGEEERRAVDQVIESGWITEGPICAAFSRDLNALMGAPYGVLAPNGTLALALGMMAIGLGPGDEVIVPDVTFVGSATAVLLIGAVPVFVDVEPVNFQIDLDQAQGAITPRTRAIMPVHLYGAMCDMPAVLRFASAQGLLVVEDAAQALGVRHGDRHAGTFGDVGCFSFFADKTITTGEGGCVVCHDPGVYERLVRLRNQGRAARGSFVHPDIGYNFRMTDLQGAVGLAQLGKIDRIIAAKLAAHAAYASALADVPQLRVLGPAPGASFVPFRCVLMADRAEGLMAHMQARGVQPRPVFPPMHSQPCFAHLAPGARGVGRDFGNADTARRRGVCLPVSPSLTEAQIERVCETVRSYYSRGRRRD